MAGLKPTKPKKTSDRRRHAPGSGDCDLRFRTDLMGVRTSVAAGLRAGESLDVVLVRDGQMRAVACRTKAQEIVGALSAFPGLVRLIQCIEDGAEYVALVEKSSARSCTVFVSRVQQ